MRETVREKDQLPPLRTRTPAHGAQNLGRCPDQEPTSHRRTLDGLGHTARAVYSSSAFLFICHHVPTEGHIVGSLSNFPRTVL